MENFCTIDLPMYPHLVRDFYKNLRKGSREIVSSVKGIDFEITEERLDQIFGIPCDGIVHERLPDKQDGLKAIVGRDDVVGDMLAHTLSLEMRLLHHMIGGIFIPKLGQFDFISERELMVMYHIIRGIPLNLLGIMMHQMREVAAKKKVCLPYGIPLMRVFLEVGILLENEIYKKLSYFDIYDDRTLNRISYEVVKDRWVKKVSSQERWRAEQAGEPFTPATLAPSSLSPPSPVPAPTPTSHVSPATPSALPPVVP